MILAGVLVAAVVVPYILLDDHLCKRPSPAGMGSLVRPSRKKTICWPIYRLCLEHRPSPANALPTPIEQAFRFDITPQWVASRWPRATTVAGDPKQLGMRVAMVSGKSPR